jgi:hypothetical protein
MPPAVPDNPKGKSCNTLFAALRGPLERSLMHYEPPPSSNLRNLRDRLSFTNGQMARMFGVATGRQFHKYLSEEDKREMGFHVLMYGMAQLQLMRGPIVNVEQLHALGRELGAVIDLDMAGEQLP